MRKFSGLALLLFLLTMGSVLSAQSLKILHAPSNTKSLESGKLLAADYNLLAEEKISLESNMSRLIVWDELDGLCIVQAKKLSDRKWKTSGTVKELKTPMSALPLKDRDATFSSLSDLKKRFEDRDYLILGNSYLIAKKGQFRPSGDTVVFVHYRDAIDNMQVSRKLEFASDTLLLYPKLILDNNGMALKAEHTSNFELLWIDRITHDLGPLCAFNCVMPDNEIVSREVGLLLGQLAEKRMSTEEMKPWVNAFLTASFGQADAHNIEQWLVANFPLTFSTPR